ncbi:hypothetical protein MBLNU457_1937t1 [Dothideomycetes sp. NU457]
MAIINAYTLIRTLSIFHITAAYFLLTAPKKLADQSIVVVMGEAMRIAPSSHFNKPTETTALTAVVLAMAGVSDLVSASLPEITALEYWISQVPVRLTLLFGFTGYIWLFKDDGMFGSASGTIGRLGQQGPGHLLKNDLMFTIGFMEVCAWFWVFSLLREERGRFSERLAEKRRMEDEMSRL